MKLSLWFSVLLVSSLGVDHSKAIFPERERYTDGTNQQLMQSKADNPNANKLIEEATSLMRQGDTESLRIALIKTLAARAQYQQKKKQTGGGCRFAESGKDSSAVGRNRECLSL